MKISAVDSDNNLFVLHDVVDPALVEKLQQHDWLHMTGVGNLPQEHWPRLNLFWRQDALLRELDTQLRWARYDIEQHLGLYFAYCYTDYWLDRGGFEVPIHTDSIIASSMQLYWMGPQGSGTTFLHSKNAQDVRYQVEFRANTGYLMLNMPQRGVQPLQWHGMFQPLDADVLRLSSYTRLGSYWPHR